MYVKYDPDADALYVRLREPEGEVHTRPLDDLRIVDYDERNAVVGVELLAVLEVGVKLEGLPEAERIDQALASLRELRSA
jgi:uncharacterized protein YuzE